MHNLTDENFVIFAMKYYDNPHCKGVAEFNDDLKRFKYLKRLFRKHTAGGGLKIRLILNHIIIITNLFGNEAATKMLFFKIDEKYWPQLKSFLLYLNIMPADNVMIDIDQEILQSLRKI